MKRYPLILAGALLVLCSPRVFAQVNCSTINQGITTTFSGGTPSTPTTFTMNSTPAFSPLAGSINLGGKTITFRTCGNQRTSAYYWTQSSQNRLEAFSCPFTRMPRACPGVGYNP